MRQGDGADLLGPNDPRSASIGVIYVAPSDDRQTVLTAILTQDKLGRKQVVVVLPEQNKAFQRPVDFDGLKNMRRGLKAQIAFVAPSGPGPAEFARQRRFPVYSSLESFSQSLKVATTVNGTTSGPAKRGIFGFGRKQEAAAAVAVASVSSSRVEEEPTSPLPTNRSVDIPQQESIPPKPGSGEDPDVADEKNGSTGHNAAAIGMVGLAAGVGFAALADDHNASSTLENSEVDWHAQSPADAGSHVNEDALSSSTPVQDSEEPRTPGSNGVQDRTDPGPEIITFSTAASRPRTTRKLPVPPVEAAAVPIIATASTALPNGSSAAPPSGRGSTGKRAAVGAGAGVGAAMVSRAASGGGGLPPSGSSPGGPGGGLPPSGSSPGGPGGGGGVGGSRRRRQLLAILLIILTLLLIGGIAAAAVPGGLGSIAHVIPGVSATATVTITPKSQTVSNTFAILAVTGTPDPNKREVAARILTATSPTQSKTVTSTGSIPGLRATGALTFLNTSNSTKSFGSVILRGASGVAVSFNGPISVPAVPPASVTVTGFAVNVGSAGNIGVLDISGSCCAAGITVKNGAFGGGQDPQPNSIVQQSDINGAANALAASLTPGTQSDLQKQVKPNQQVVPNTFKCNKSTFNANHKAGDHAPSVTVTVAVTCTEEVYDQQAALTMAANLLKAQASKDPGPAYALTGNIVTGVTKATVLDTKGTVSLLVSAQGVWVYQFSNAVKQDFANHIANMSEQDAKTYLLGQPGVSDVKIVISSGTTLPDASHITIEIVAIPGATGTPTTGTPTVTPGSPTPTGAVTPPVTPTPTQGLGGS
jgi:hypothetical protein